MNQTNSTEAGPVAVVEQETNDEELINVYNRLKKVFSCWNKEMMVTRNEVDRLYNVGGLFWFSDANLSKLSTYGFEFQWLDPKNGVLEIVVRDNLPTILGQDQR